MTTIEERVEATRNGHNPTVVCKVPSGWVVMCDMQYLPGYCILLADPVVESLNTLDPALRGQYLGDMALVGDALMEVTGAFRINYAIMGNTDPYLHAHIVPRYLSEPDENRRVTPWSYSRDVIDANLFDPAAHRPLMEALRAAIGKRL
jgi:diadenosine tetraphosphate (Ap4A) HIT family hydrolase